MGRGLCEDSPALRNGRACATSYPVQILQGLLWVFATPDESLAASKTAALIPELDDSSFVDATDFFGPHCRFS
jgi:phenylpropionate dioxygenase-like ring-hydroxylating dioxygenase large terminal subunit